MYLIVKLQICIRQPYLQRMWLPCQILEFLKHTLCPWHKPFSGWGPSWPWLYGSWIYNNLCNQCLSPLMLWVWISIRARCTTLCDKVCQWLATGLWFSPGPLVFSTNKTDHDITEILLKVALNTIKQTNKKLSVVVIFDGLIIRWQ